MMIVGTTVMGCKTVSLSIKRLWVQVQGRT